MKKMTYMFLFKLFVTNIYLSLSYPAHVRFCKSFLLQFFKIKKKYIFNCHTAHNSSQLHIFLILMRSLINAIDSLTKNILQTKVITLNNKTTISLSLGKKIKIFSVAIYKTNRKTI